MRAWGIWVVVLAVSVLAGQVQAGEAQDRLFATGVLADIAAGQRLVYRYDHAGDEAGAVRLGVVQSGEGAREALVEIDEGGRTRRLDPMSAGAGNPVFLVFMEDVVRAVAEESGGSPFYIRNRLREALRSQDSTEAAEVTVGGAQVAGRELRFRPFADDAHAAELGALADLEVRFSVSEGVPGGFAWMEAVAGEQGTDGPMLRRAVIFERQEAAE